MLAGARRDPPGPVRRAHLAAGTASRCSSPARRGRRPRGRDAPGDDLHRHRRRPRPAARLRLRRHRRRRRAARSPRRWSPTSAAPRCGSPEEQAHALPRGPRPRRQPPGHPGHPGDGAARRRRRRRTRPRRCARCSPPRSTTRSPHGDAALTGPIVRGDVEHRPRPPRRHRRHRARRRCRRTSRWPAPPLDRAVTDGRLLPIRARRDPSACSTTAAAPAADAPGARATHRADA